AIPQPSASLLTRTSRAPRRSATPYPYTTLFRSGTWTTPQNWSPNAVFTWTTTGLASGDYLFEVQARSAGSSSWQVYRDVLYTLSGSTSTPCTGVSFSPSPGSPQAPGTMVAWAASANGCSSAEYLITVLAPNGVW